MILLLLHNSVMAEEDASNTDSDDATGTKSKKVAIVTLVTTSTYLPGVFVLGESLQEVQASGDKIVLWVGPDEDPRSDLTEEHMAQLTSSYNWDRTIQLSKANGTYTECRISTQQKEMIDQNPSLVGLDRYWGTCSKFAVWTLTDYDVVIYMDADSIALNNFDFCFDYLEQNSQDSSDAASVQHDYSFAAHGVPESWDTDPPTWGNFYTAFMVIKPLPNVQSYFHSLASQQFLAEGEITLLNQVIQHWKPLPRYTLVAQTETVRPINPVTGQIDWNQVNVYDFAGKPETKPWVSYALSKQHLDPHWHAYFGSMRPETEAYQRYMIPQLLWNKYYDRILERQKQQEQAKATAPTTTADQEL